MEQVAKFYEDTVAFWGDIAPGTLQKEGIGSVFGVFCYRAHMVNAAQSDSANVRSLFILLLL